MFWLIIYILNKSYTCSLLTKTRRSISIPAILPIIKNVAKHTRIILLKGGKLKIIEDVPPINNPIITPNNEYIAV